MRKVTDRIKMKCVLLSEDGGDNWEVERIYYVAGQDTPSGHFLDSEPYENMELKRVKEGE